MKKRRNWMAWKAKREAELRQRREMQKILDRAVGYWMDAQIKSMHEPGGFIARLMASMPMPYFGGKKIQSAIIYKDN